MLDAIALPPSPVNEPVLDYAPKSAERARLKAELSRMSAETIEIPIHIGGKDVTTGDLVDVRAPHKRSLIVARAHQGDASHAAKAIAAAQRARGEWSSMPREARAAIFLKAADLLATRLRPVLNAATMLGQSKTAHQAEIDSACELVDFLRFNVHFAARLAAEQPISGPGVWNALEMRPLEGFVLASTPFNFTADRRKPPSGAGADGQHRGLEAVAERGLLGTFS